MNKDEKENEAQNTNQKESSTSTQKDNHADIYVFNSAIVDAIKFTYKEPFDPLFEKGAHSGPIIALSQTPAKSICGTQSNDKTLKLWNFASEQKIMQSYSFFENEMAFDLHPLSLQCAIGFKEGLRVYFILEEELRCSYENFSKPCNAQKYSEAGNWLAVGMQNEVVVMDAYSLTIQKTFKGHSSAIKELSWLNKDQKLQSSCVNYNVNVWNLIIERNFNEMDNQDKEDKIRHVEHYKPSDKKIKYYDIAYDNEFASGNLS